MIVFSPHADDVVLSFGETMTQPSWRPAPRVITVFGGPGPDDLLTHYDAKCGFTSAQEAITARWREDWWAMGSLGPFDLETWDFVDHQYGVPVNTDKLFNKVADVIRANRAETFVLPVGINHPDHETVSNVVLHVFHDYPVARILLYEDLPSRVLHPELVTPRLDQIREDGWTIDPLYVGRGDVLTKEAAIRCYRSQLQELDWRSCLVPERIWEARR